MTRGEFKNKIKELQMKIERWKDMQLVKVPFNVEAGVGLS